MSFLLLGVLILLLARHWPRLKYLISCFIVLFLFTNIHSRFYPSESGDTPTFHLASPWGCSPLTHMGDWQWNLVSKSILSNNKIPPFLWCSFWLCASCDIEFVITVWIYPNPIQSKYLQDIYLSWLCFVFSADSLLLLNYTNHMLPMLKHHNHSEWSSALLKNFFRAAHMAPRLLVLFLSFIYQCYNPIETARCAVHALWYIIQFAVWHFFGIGIYICLFVLFFKPLRQCKLWLLWKAGWCISAANCNQVGRVRERQLPHR